MIFLFTRDFILFVKTLLSRKKKVLCGSRSKSLVYDTKTKLLETTGRIDELAFDDGFSSNVIPSDCGPFIQIMRLCGIKRNWLSMMCYTCSEAKRSGEMTAHDLNINKLESWKNVLANFLSKRPR